MTKKLVMMVGIPGCGKSTWANSWFPGRIVSSDEIRKELSDDYDLYGTIPFNNQVFQTFHERLTVFLQNPSMISDNHKQAVIVADSTALDGYARATLREIATKTKSQIHAIVFTNPTQAITRNAAREDNAITGATRVPWDAMTRMIAKYEKSLIEIPREEYDSVTYIKEVR